MESSLLLWYSTGSEVKSMTFNRSYKLDEIITPYTFGLIKNGNPFMVFTDNLQILEGDEIDKWNRINGLTDNTPRVVGHKTTARGGEPIYVIHHVNDISSVIIPMERCEIFPMYEDFMYQLKADLKEF